MGDWLKNFEERLVHRFPKGLKIKYKFGPLNTITFRIGGFKYAPMKRLEFAGGGDRFFPVTFSAGEVLKEDIYENMQGIIDAFKEEETKQRKREKEERMKERGMNEKIEELDWG